MLKFYIYFYLFLSIFVSRERERLLLLMREIKHVKLVDDIFRQILFNIYIFIDYLN